MCYRLNMRDICRFGVRHVELLIRGRALSIQLCLPLIAILHTNFPRYRDPHWEKKSSGAWSSLEKCSLWLLDLSKLAAIFLFQSDMSWIFLSRGLFCLFCYLFIFLFIVLCSTLLYWSVILRMSDCRRSERNRAPSNVVKMSAHSEFVLPVLLLRQASQSVIIARYARWVLCS